MTRYVKPDADQIVAIALATAAHILDHVRGSRCDVDDIDHEATVALVQAIVNHPEDRASHVLESVLGTNTLSGSGSLAVPT